MRVKLAPTHPLDLAADPPALLQAAEVALLAARLQKCSQNHLCGNVTHQPPQPAAAEAWLNCLSGTFRAALAAEAELLVTLPGGGWTHWVAPGARPRCALEALALATTRFHLERCNMSSLMVGAEWWVQVRDMDESMPMHWDCDEELAARTGEHASPYLATVTYVTSSGSPTLVLPVTADRRGCAVVEPRTAGGGRHGGGGGGSQAGRCGGSHGGGENAGGSSGGGGGGGGCSDDEDSGDGDEGGGEVGSRSQRSAHCGGDSSGGSNDDVGDGDGAYVSFPVAGKHFAFNGRLLHGTQHDGEVRAALGSNPLGCARFQYDRIRCMRSGWEVLQGGGGDIL